MVEIHKTTEKDHEKYCVKSAGAIEGHVQCIGEGICFRDLEIFHDKEV